MAIIPYPEVQVFPDSQYANKQVILLYIGRDTADGFAQRLTINGHFAFHNQRLSVATCYDVEQSWLASTTEIREVE